MVPIEPLLARVSKPARYTGGEWNSITKDWEKTSVRVALAYPDVYDIGMSNTGLAILYDLLNREPDCVAERVYAPWPDMESVMRETRTRSGALRPGIHCGTSTQSVSRFPTR